MSRLSLYTIATFLAAFLLVTLINWFRRRRAMDAWVGSVVRLEQAPGCVKIHYARMDGRTGVVTLDMESYASLFGSLRPGDRLRKIAGDPIPKRSEPGG